MGGQKNQSYDDKTSTMQPDDASVKEDQSKGGESQAQTENTDETAEVIEMEEEETVL